MGEIATWGQLSTESEPAWLAFVAYRNAGVTRSLKKTARAIGKAKRGIETWSSKHNWQDRVAAWDLEQQDLHRDARVQAISDAEERHGKLARALLGRVAAELGAQVKGRCESCGRSPTKLTAGQVATALKAGVEVERLALGQSTAGASVVSQTNTTNVVSTTTALVLLRDPVSQRLASELLGRMRALDPATSLRRLAGAQAAAALAGNGGGESKPTGHAAKKAARARALEERRDVHLLAADPSGPARTAAKELGGASAAAIDVEANVAEATREHERQRYAAQLAAAARRRRLAEEDAADDDVDLFPEEFE